jgi:hypothetical protein
MPIRLKLAVRLVDAIPAKSGGFLKHYEYK